jgi:prepilin-type N-terminal cleavage/methylation domain-containing protein
MKKAIANFRLPVSQRRRASASVRDGGIGNWQWTVGNASAFTLLELLVVIAILGILAALGVPALKNMGKSNIQISASRQLLDDLGRARQLAISQHTTVYMIFVPENFWIQSGNMNWWNSLTPMQQAAGTNLLDKQFTGYTFVSLRSVGDQPGQGRARYISDWKSLPDGAFIATNKFNTYYYPYPNSSIYYPIINNSSASPVVYPIYSFNYTNSLPFPTATNFNSSVSLPYVAFNYLGQLTVDGTQLSRRDEYIPLAQGGVSYAVDGNKALQLLPPDATENPPGNSTNSMFNVIRVDRLTGRATLLQQKLQ